MDWSSENLTRIGISGSDIFWRVLSEPFGDAPHLRLERPRRREVENAGTDIAPILEVMWSFTGNENESSLRAFEPLLVHANAHDSFDDVEEIVFSVRMNAGSPRSRLKPPFRYR